MSSRRSRSRSRESLRSPIDLRAAFRPGQQNARASPAQPRVEEPARPQPHRLFDRMLLQREKFKSSAALVADAHWALQRFPDMDMSQLLLAIETADTNNLGLGRLFVSLREKGQVTAERLVEGLSDISRRSTDLPSLWRALMRPARSDVALDVKFAQVSEMVNKLFSNQSQKNSEFREIVAFLGWLNHMTEAEFNKCTSLMNDLTDVSSAGLGAVKDKLLRNGPIEVPVVEDFVNSPEESEKSVPITPQRVISTSAPPNEVTGGQESTVPRQQAEPQSLDMHCFIWTAHKYSPRRHGYAIVWPNNDQISMSGNFRNDWPIALVEAEAVIKALHTAKANLKNSVAKVYVHVSTLGRKKILDRLHNYQRGDKEYPIDRLKEALQGLQVVFESFEKHTKSRDWRFQWINRAITDAEVALSKSR